MIITSRTVWGAVHGQGDVALGNLKLVVIHHTAGPKIAEDASPAEEYAVTKEFERQHVEDNGWKGIGYNHLIYPSGRIHEGRGFRRVGAHTPKQNSKSLGVAFVMNAEVENPTKQAIDSCRELLGYAQTKNHLASGFEIKGHRDYDSTKCPGTKLYVMLDTLHPNLATITIKQHLAVIEERISMIKALL